MVLPLGGVQGRSLITVPPFSSESLSQIPDNAFFSGYPEPLKRRCNLLVNVRKWSAIFLFEIVFHKFFFTVFVLARTCAANF